MAYDFLIRKIHWQDGYYDLAVAKDKIAGLWPWQESMPAAEASTTIQGHGNVLLPGLTDCHVHLREPGQEKKETISSGLHAAAGGGFSDVLAMANTHPVNDHPQITTAILDKARESWPNGPFLHPVGALSKDLQGRDVAPLQALAEAGCIAFSNDGIPIRDNALFMKALSESGKIGKIVIDHCEDPDISGNGLVNNGKISSYLGLKGQPSVAESLQVARDILISAYLGIPVHLAHISCRESVELIAWAKSKDIQVTAETCPHYLLWDETLTLDCNTLAKVNPPLRTWDDVLALRQAVREKTIDILTTDHAPHTMAEKNKPFSKAPFGISGLDTALSLTWSLLQDNIIDIHDLKRCWHYSPRKIHALPERILAPGAEATFILFDPDWTWEVNSDNIISRGKNTPCLGLVLKGKVTANFIQGKQIYTINKEEMMD